MADTALAFLEAELQAERWLPVVGFPAYEVSDLGRVRSIDRIDVFTRKEASGKITTIRRRMRGTLLRAGTVPSGHLLVVLGRGHSRLVHRLVLDAFVGPRPHGKEALHGDGEPSNNRLWNLRWGTRSENVADTRRHGTMPLGDNHVGAILRSVDIPLIRTLLRTKTQYEIAEIYGVHRSTILNIHLGKTWKHVA